MSEGEIICCFDIGIKNLAFCFYQNDTNKKILGWSNYNLLDNKDVSEVKEMYKCVTCNKNATYTNDTKYYCAKHIVKPIFKDVSGNVFKKMPNLTYLRDLFKVKKATKEELYNKVKESYSVLIEKKKALKKNFNMEESHDSIRKLILDNKELFLKAKHIGLENQPVLKNPNMKSIQILLYATLRDILQPNPPSMHLIHAGKKIQGKETGEAGYKDRKTASIELTKDFLKKNVQDEKFVHMFQNSLKKDDLADCLLMCLYFNK